MIIFPYYELATVVLFSGALFILLWRAVKKHKFASETVQELVRTVTASRVLDEISSSLFTTLDNKFGIENGYIAVLESGLPVWASSYKIDTHNIDVPLLQTMMLEQLREQNKVLFDVHELKHDDLRKRLSDLGIHVMIPLVVSHEIAGIVLLGRKRHGSGYSATERDIIQTLEPVLTLSIKNAFFNKKLGEISTTLHDTVEKAKGEVAVAQKKVAEMDASKDEFIQIASHELRTPITAIKGYIWICLNQSKQPLEETVKKNLDTCYHSAERLLRMVSDMLTVSRMDSGKMALNYQRVDIASLLGALQEEMLPVANQREIQFTLKLDKPSVPIEGDRERLQELFHNIIDNALKFAPHRGLVRVELHVNGDRDVSVLVSDNGPGIPREGRDKLFAKFGKIQYAYDKTHAVEGAGLGLYIGKRIVDLHSGIIAVESEVDKGTTFIVTLPFQKKK